jgi:hypothetical protein
MIPMMILHRILNNMDKQRIENSKKMTGLAALNELSDQEKRNKYQLVDERYIPKSKYKDGTANELTSAVVRFLQLKSHWATRINTMGKYLTHERKWIPGTTQRGTADIHTVINGRHVSLELKIGRDKMSPDQVETKRQIEASGGVYMVIKTFQEFYDWYMNYTNNKQ